VNDSESDASSLSKWSKDNTIWAKCQLRSIFQRGRTRRWTERRPCSRPACPRPLRNST